MTDERKNTKHVMISSTARDLPEHRKEVMDACLRQGMFPMMMEHLPASDDEAIGASLKIVDEADIYLGVFAHRYGYVPKAGNPAQISVTEMEYNRAVERKIPRCIFVIDTEHPLKIDDVEMGAGAAKLKAFKERVQTENIVNFFKSPADLRACVINSLSKLREPDLTAFHYVSDIPAPPEAYIAHPYTLLQTHRLIGRQDELNLLTDWVTSAGKGEAFFDGSSVEKCFAPTTRIMNIVAIGGMGKSALTWKWFNDIAPQEMKPIAGRMWWSFYESDASFENFVIRALAYVTRQSREEVQKIPSPEREAQLLAALDREPFLLVLDGLERVLLAYARMDAARLNDGQVGSEKKLRKTSDPRVGSFLKRLAQVKNSRILVSSRLYPAELETETGDPIPGSFRHDISGLTDEDAVELWRAVGITGSREELLPIFTKFDKHPLLIQALAGEVKNYRRAPSNFAEWRKANPNFDPAECARVQDAMAHVLEYALRGLDDKARKVLETVAAFRMPASYDTLAALFVGEGKLFPAELGLDVALKELEDRGLLGWDKRANRYDLHPIVRGIVWNGLPDHTRRGVYTTLHAHFEAVPKMDDWQKVNTLEDLTPAIELYSTLIGLGRYDDAEALFYQRIYMPTAYKLGNLRDGTQLLEALFTKGLEDLPQVSQPDAQVTAIGELASMLRASGRVKESLMLMHSAYSLTKQTTISEAIGDDIIMYKLGDLLLVCGKLRDSEFLLRKALLLLYKRKDQEDEMLILGTLVFSNLIRGNAKSVSEFKRKIERGMSRGEIAARGLPIVAWVVLESAVRMQENTIAELTLSSKEIISWFKDAEIDRVKFSRLQGQSALVLENYASAQEHLHYALTRARAVNFVEEELQSLVALAELRRRQKDLKAARELLDDVWEHAERGPYPLLHADAFNVLAQIERDAGNNAAAVDAATKAYRLAWCDGEPYAYHWGLVAARKHLRELGAPEPPMPPFDESKYEPMPEVEINPKDEYFVEEGK